MSEWLTNDPLCDGVLAILRSGKVETRDFLRPIFKWLKAGNKHYNPDKAFLYVEWMIEIRDNGDDTLAITRQPHIQPKYAYNTIVTMCQRNSDHSNAMRAYHCMIQYSFDPDVFTMTALLDVIGRNGLFQEAMKLYQSMIESEDNLPNVVTFVTLIRVASNLKDKIAAKKYVQMLLEDARRLVRSSQINVQIGDKDGNVAVSIFNASLSACVRMNDLAYFASILADMSVSGVEWTTLTHDIISKFYYRKRDSFPSLSAYLSNLVQLNAFSPSRIDELHEYVEKYVLEKDTNTSEKKFYAGCLGPDAPQSLRVSVMVHDLSKLLDRLDPEDTSQLTESDFVTLLHQCRKRRWSDQIEYIISQMESVSTEGVPASGIAPVIHLTPSRLTFEAALDGYFHADQPAEASLLLSRILEADIDIDESFLYFTTWGFMRCGDATLATQAFLAITHKDVVPTEEVIVCLLRGLGRDIDLAFAVFLSLFEGKFSEELNETCLQRFILVLLESSAVLGFPQGIDKFCDLFLNFPHHLLWDCFRTIIDTSNPSFSTICIMAASNVPDILTGFQYLRKWQDAGLIPSLIPYYSLSLEFYASCLDGSFLIPQPPELKSLPFRGFLRFGPLKYADLKSGYMHKVFSQLEEDRKHHSPHYCKFLVSAVCHSEASFNTFLTSLKCFPENGSDDLLLAHYITAYLACRSSFVIQMLLQYLFTKTLFIRSKQDKSLLLSALTKALSPLSKSDFDSFFIDTLKYLSLLEVSGKQQSKVLSILFLSLKVNDTISDTVERAFTQMEIRPCIDILKELCKQCPLLSSDAKRYVTKLLLSYMEHQQESPIRVVQMFKPFDLFNTIDTIHADTTLVNCFLRDPNSHWMALTTYIGDHEDRSDACRRICRLLIQNESQDLVLKILTKFQYFTDSEFQHLLHPSEQLFTNTADEEQNYSVPTFHLAQFPQQLVLVNDMESLQIALKVFAKLETGGIVAIDSEWRPFTPLSTKNKCSLLQIATATHVFLLDLMILEPCWQDSHTPKMMELHQLYSEMILALFSNQNILKLGRPYIIFFLLI